MRLRVFSARSSSAAMAAIAEALGPDAIIIETETLPGGMVKVTAAAPDEPAAPAPVGDDPTDAMVEALDRHGVPERLADRLMTAAISFARATSDPVLILAGALDAVFAFKPLSDRPVPQPLMLVGPPGAGKTVSVAKLAVRMTLAGQPPAVVTTDTARAGAVAQLEAFTRILGVTLHRCDDAASLAALVERERGADRRLLIDTAGINPYSASDREDLHSLIEASGAEPVLVLPAGVDAIDAGETADAFAALGCRRLVGTRLDAVLRLGSLLAAVDKAKLAFADAGITPNVSDGLAPLNPVAFARLLMPSPAPLAAAKPSLFTKVPTT